MSHTIVGRKGDAVIEIAPSYNRSLKWILEGAELSTHNDTQFFINARHEDATDFEHDASHMARFEFVGFSVQYMYGSGLGVRGYLTSAHFYPEGQSFEVGTDMPHSLDDEEIRVCDDTEYYHPEGCDWPAGHLIMPYLPPEQKITPAMCDIRIDFKRDR